MFKELRDKKLFKRIEMAEEYKELRKYLDDLYAEICPAENPTYTTFELESEFLRTGNRVHFEEKYFLRRTQLSLCAVLSAVYPDETKYISELEELIYQICNEYSWQLPAHRPKDNWNRRDDIDLFSAETGLYLAEIKYMLADRLNPVIVNRITKELKWRILDSFEKHTFWWEELKSNWASVCAGSVGTVFMYEDESRFATIIERINACMDNYLSGIYDEGSTSEGANYWSYGFSFFTLYQDMLRRYTGGSVDGFKNDKVKRIAGFLTNLYLDEENVVLFSDSIESARYPKWLIAFLKSEYNIDLPPKSKGDFSIEKFSSAIRGLVYYDENYDCEPNRLGKIYYEELQWYIEKKAQYSIAVKGGHNDEEHNHNDIGSFMIVHNGHKILTDLGRGEYTADYCGENRYNCLETSALGHSVPLINDVFQVYGREYYGTMSVKENTVTVDMSKAYSVEIDTFNRQFEMFEDKIVLTDFYDSSLKVKERFITEIEPIIDVKNCIILADAKLCFPSGWKLNCSREIRKKYDGKSEREIFILDFTSSEITDKFEMDIKFKGI